MKQKNSHSHSYTNTQVLLTLSTNSNNNVESLKKIEMTKLTLQFNNFKFLKQDVLKSVIQIIGESEMVDYKGYNKKKKKQSQ